MKLCLWRPTVLALFAYVNGTLQCFPLPEVVVVVVAHGALHKVKSRQRCQVVAGRGRSRPAL